MLSTLLGPLKSEVLIALLTQPALGSSAPLFSQERMPAAFKSNKQEKRVRRERDREMKERERAGGREEAKQGISNLKPFSSDEEIGVLLKPSMKPRDDNPFFNTVLQITIRKVNMQHQCKKEGNIIRQGGAPQHGQSYQSHRASPDISPRSLQYCRTGEPITISPQKNPPTFSYMETPVPALKWLWRRAGWSQLFLRSQQG